MLAQCSDAGYIIAKDLPPGFCNYLTDLEERYISPLLFLCVYLPKSLKPKTSSLLMFNVTSVITNFSMREQKRRRLKEV